jgi:hypothetical protein
VDDAGVGDHDVQAPEPSYRLGHQVFLTGRVGHVHRHGVPSPAGLDDLGGDASGPLAVEIADDDGRPVTCQLEGDRPTDTACPAGDDGYLARQTSLHHASLHHASLHARRSFDDRPAGAVTIPPAPPGSPGLSVDPGRGRSPGGRARLVPGRGDRTSPRVDHR